MEVYLLEIRTTANPSEDDWSVRGSNGAQAMAQSVKSVPGKSKELSSGLRTHKKKMPGVVAQELQLSKH